MVKLRLTRMGRKKRPYYRIIAIDSRKRRDGAYLEKLGTYNPVAHVEAEETTIDHEGALNWLLKGAQPTRTVENILRKEGILLKYDMINRFKTEKKVSTKNGKEIVKYTVVKDENGVPVRKFTDEEVEKAFTSWQEAQETKKAKKIAKKSTKLSKKAKAKLAEEASAKATNQE